MKMDASTSPEADLNVCNFFFHIQNTNFPQNLKPSTVIKYTKLPEFDFDSKVIWPQKNTYVLQPRLRRIVTINDEENVMRTSRSLRSELGAPSFNPKKKFSSISEEAGTPNQSRRRTENRVSSAPKSSYKSLESKPEVHKQRIFQLAKTTRNKQESTSSAKFYALSNNNRSCSPVSGSSRTKNQVDTKTNQMQDNNNSVSKEKEKPPKRQVNTKVYSKNGTGNKISPRPSKSSSEKEIFLIKSKFTEKVKSEIQPKSFISSSTNVSPIQTVKSKLKRPSIIHVPLDKGKTDTSAYRQSNTIKIDCFTEVDHNVTHNVTTREMNVGTNPEPIKIDVVTEIHNEILSKTDCSQQTDETEVYIEECRSEPLDNLEVPDVTLNKERSETQKEIKVAYSQSLPHLEVPTMTITPRKLRNPNLELQSKSTSYIIGRATVTYTTKQEFDFHVVNNPHQLVSKKSSSPLVYPMNVVSVLKKEISKELGELPETKKDTLKEKNDVSNTNLTNCLNEIKALNCSYIFESSKLAKPSKIISSISVNKDLLQGDYICEQFQRELNFIDSFFESLQYLENCSLSEQKMENIVSKTGFDIKTPEFHSLFSKFENCTNIDDTETMASKSLCLLNLLIRDEQRRAKNLLFVLKMREAALKDFTKSQILWLENKKKQENTDIPTLKKKQRGALLKLQHECGEMQRMRKALLALSEKRKVALMKTKKNIELRLKNNVTVNEIFLGKKKLKRSSSVDRCTGVPLKCFDLSSSGCDESSTSRTKTDFIEVELLQNDSNTKSAEKSIQTGDSLLKAFAHQSTDTAAEHFLTVDGAYLNILFANLSLPEIFSSDKQYEVNEEALRSVVNSTNNIKNYSSQGAIVEKLLEQFNNRELDISTTPSTARSLVEELNQYYKGLNEEDKISEDSVEEEKPSPSLNKSCSVIIDTQTDKCEGFRNSSSMTNTDHERLNIATITSSSHCCSNSVSTQVMKEKESTSAATQIEPPGSKDALLKDSSTGRDIIPIDRPASTASFSTESSASLCGISSLASVSEHNEAEELLRQQLAIEREIKALEQQQCQLLVVREIPDKPPPPYTPPTETRVQKLPPKFIADNTIEDKVLKNLTDTIIVSIEPKSSFDVFLEEFCLESTAKHEAQLSDKPWDSCNLLPQKPPLEKLELVQKTSADLRDVLSGVPSTAVSGMGGRRTDHIDDILFAEWRRCEPEWTALHSDEAIVKNQIFEGIFQKILTDTIDEYKKTIIAKEELPCE